MARAWIWLASSALWLATQAIAQSMDPSSSELDDRLAEEARLSWIEHAALARNPALGESRTRALAAAERARAAGALPDPEFKYEQWGVPLNRPYALNRADALLFGLRQAIPEHGTRKARARVAAEDARIVAAQGHAVERDLLLQVREAFFEYYAADRVLRVHQEHVGVAEQIVAQVRTSYSAGQGNQQDVLKVLVELSRLHNELADIRQQRESARLTLNALMARSPDAPLGPPADLPRPPSALDVNALDEARTAKRPELSAAYSAIERSRAMLDGAKRAARFPVFTVGADYWLMPTLAMPHAYGAMVTMSLPWLSRARRADVREAEHALSAEHSAAEVVEIRTAFELRDAIARLDAANASLEVVERDLLMQAEQSLQAAKASYAAGQTSLLSLLDALRSYFEVRLEHSRALSRVMTEVAHVEFTSGARLISPAASETFP